jgi:hypothetical protein
MASGDRFSSSPIPRGYGRAELHPRDQSANLADILERVLDKGIVIAGDIQVNLLEIELLTIKLRLLVASVDRAREMGINWWESDPMLSSRAQDQVDGENKQLRARVERLEKMLEEGKGGRKREAGGASGR